MIEIIILLVITILVGIIIYTVFLLMNELERTVVAIIERQEAIVERQDIHSDMIDSVQEQCHIINSRIGYLKYRLRKLEEKEE